MSSLTHEPTEKSSVLSGKLESVKVRSGFRTACPMTPVTELVGVESTVMLGEKGEP